MRSPVFAEHQRRQAASVVVHGYREVLCDEHDVLELGPPDAGHLGHLPSEHLLQGVGRAVDVAFGDVSALPVLAVGVGYAGGYRLALASAHLGQDAVGDRPHGHLRDLGHDRPLGYHRGHGDQVLLAYPRLDERYVEGVEVRDLAHRGAAGDEELRRYELHGNANGRTLLSLSVRRLSAVEGPFQQEPEVKYKLYAYVLYSWQMENLVHC